MRILLLGTWRRASFRARLVGVAAGALLADVLSKFVGVALLEPGSLELGWVRLRVIRNPGFVFGIGASMSSGVVLIVAVIVATVVVMAAWRGWLSEPGAAGLILGGALANVLDRAMDGKVLDLIDVGPGPRSTSPTHLS